MVFYCKVICLPCQVHDDPVHRNPGGTMTGDQMRLSGIGVVLFLGALILSHLLNYPYEMEPLYDQDKKLRLTLRGIALPDLQSKNATFVNLILRNDSDKPYGGDISELDFLLRRSSLVLTDGTGKTHKLVGLPWRFPYQDEPLPPKTERATWFIFDGVYEGIDTLQISGLPWQFPLVTLKAQLPSFLYAFDYNPWLLPLVVVAGGFAILVSAWKVASVRRFLIAILGMQAAFACLYATTVGI